MDSCTYARISEIDRSSGVLKFDQELSGELAWLPWGRGGSGSSPIGPTSPESLLGCPFSYRQSACFAPDRHPVVSAVLLRGARATECL